MERSELGKKPISPDKPAGEDIKYEPEFEELQAEIDKLTSVTGGVPDWKKVSELGQQILATRSKDMKVASYLCIGLLHTEGLKGLSQGLTAYKDMLSNFWDQLYPPKKRLRGRIGAISWLTERLERYLESMEIKEEDGADAKSCREVLGDLEGLLDDLMGDKAPTLRPVIRLLERWPEPAAPEKEPETIPEPEKEPVHEPQVKPEAKPVPPPPSAPKVSLEELTTSAQVQKALRDQLAALRRLSGVIQEQTPHSPIPYHLLFMSIWVQIEQAPPNQDGKTRIPPPPDPLVTRLKALEQKGAWSELLKECLTRVTEMPLWLDLARYVFISLSGQGQEWDKAAQAVLQQSRILLERVPDLADLAFSNGTPLASSSTKNWISDQVLIHKSISQPAPETIPVVNAKRLGAHPVQAFISQAESLKATGDLKGALNVLLQGVSSSQGLEGAFRCRLEMAKLCVESDRFSLAQPILEGLLRQIDQYDIEQWQPELAAETIYQLYRCQQGLLKNQPPSPEQRERIRELYARLCRLDPVRALSVASA